MKTRVSRRIAVKTRHRHLEIVVVVDRDLDLDRRQGHRADDDVLDQDRTAVVTIGDRVGHLDVELDRDRRLQGEDKSSSSNEEIVIRVLLGDAVRVILDSGQLPQLVIAENHLLHREDRVRDRDHVRARLELVVIKIGDENLHHLRPPPLHHHHHLLHLQKDAQNIDVPTGERPHPLPHRRRPVDREQIVQTNAYPLAAI